MDIAINGNFLSTGFYRISREITTATMLNLDEKLSDTAISNASNAFSWWYPTFTGAWENAIQKTSNLLVCCVALRDNSNSFNLNVITLLSWMDLWLFLIVKRYWILPTGFDAKIVHLSESAVLLQHSRQVYTLYFRHTVLRFSFHCLTFFVSTYSGQ